MTHILITGFPGFLGTRLLPRLVEPRGEQLAACVVEPRMAERARTTLAGLEAEHPHLAGRVRLLEGDLTRRDVLSPGQDPGPVTRAYHLAAAYRLDVEREVGMAVNVRGTRHLLNLVRDAPGLERVDYVSTCYVSGRHPGLFREEDLDVGQRFNNHYEETKFLAEVVVREAAEEGLPLTVYRPSVVAGHSVTGETGKLDGLYHLFQWIAAQGAVALFPRVPGAGRAVFNVVPSDLVVEGLARISRRPESVGRTYHLADPEPLPVPELVRVAARALGSRIIPVPTPLPPARWGMALAGRLPGFPRIPGEALDYLSHPTRYATSQATKALAREKIAVPRFTSYVGPLARFFRERVVPRRSGNPGSDPSASRSRSA